MRKTKIVCTMGPACSDPKVMERMLRAGMNVARFNFSHGTHEYHKKMMDTFRSVRDKLGLSAAVMLDTKWPEIRLRDFEGGSAELRTGDTFTLTTEDIIGNAERATVSYKPFIGQIKPGTRLLIDDGRVELIAEAGDDDNLLCRVSVGGRVSNHKSINVPNTPIDMPYISEADKADLLFGI